MIRTALVLLIFHFPAWAADIWGKVVAVADGDTLTVLDGTRKVKVRLIGIDAPEKRRWLWAVNEPVPPWEYRKRKREKE
jgi:endonuclease YncB( thermonuclease family)